MNNTSSSTGSSHLLRRLSPLAVWALSFGCSMGWGSFVMPGTTFLPIAGPLGSAIGIAVGALIMLIIGINYSALINRYPDSGGIFTYTREIFGYDHGFLSSWFLGLVYLAIIWANATAIPLIFRSLFGDIMCFGFHYNVAGYEVYMGEILLSLVSLLFFGLLILRGARIGAYIQIGMAFLLIVGIIVAFGSVFFNPDLAESISIRPLFSPDRAPLAGSLFMVLLAPWAFAGFESVSHSAEEFRFSHKKILSVIAISIATAAAAYILLMLIGASVRPEGFESWSDYTAALGTQEGIASVPVFYAVKSAMGSAGPIIIAITAAAGIITGFVGNITAASRMLYSMSRDELLPSSIGRLNKYGVPGRAILILLAASIPVPFFGRAAISWIIDVNTIGVVVAYAYTSAAALRTARRENRTGLKLTGILGLVISLFFLMYFLIPNLDAFTTFSTESYLILLLWAVLGFVVFYLIYRRDRQHRLGRSTFVWIVLLLLIFFTSMVWMNSTTRETNAAAVAELTSQYSEKISTLSEADIAAYGRSVADLIDRETDSVILSSIIQFALILVSLVIIFRIYGSVKRQEQTASEERDIAEESSRAKTNFLSNMSHDIRTPMNAIIGYVTLAKREKNVPARVGDYLTKIEASSDQLLALINDILEMSRIESGRIELMPVPCDLTRVMENVRSLFSTQMETKGLNYEVRCEDVRDSAVLCDENRLNRVLMNLISNAYKFTPEGGNVTAVLRQTGLEGERASFELSVKDTGIGMSEEFAAKVFEAFERERTVTVENIQGTGLGTAITKSIVDLMGGTIDVITEKGKGTEFVIHVSFDVDPNRRAAEADAAAIAGMDTSLRGLKVLLVEDNKENRDMERIMLEEAGFTVTCVENGEEAVEAVAASDPGEYDLVLMDIEMPVKNGYDATRTIRSLRNQDLARIPIAALTAKAYSEDIAAAYEAGMDGHIAKPVNIRSVLDTMAKILNKQ